MVDKAHDERLMRRRVVHLLMTWIILHALFFEQAVAKAKLFAAMDDWPPFIIDTGSVSSDSGFDGIDKELLQELAARSGVEIYLLRYPFARALQDLKTGRIDLITGIAKTPERERFIGYLSQPYYHCSVAFYALPALAERIRRYQDLEGVEIGYVRGSVYFEPFDSDRRLRKDPVLNESQLPGKLLKGRDQVFIGTDCQVDYALTQSGLVGRIIKTDYQPNQGVALYIGYSKAAGIENEIARLDSALTTLVAEGWIKRMADSYFHPWALGAK